MSGSLNKVLLIGNLGRDPELKMTTTGQPVARFSIATTETWKDKAGEKQSKTEWHNIVVWGKQAEIAEKYLKKGKQVLIEGRIQYREYQDQQGVKKTACDIRCDNFQMLGRMEDGGGRSEGSYNRGGSSSMANAPDYDDMPPPAGGPDDDIPF
ncbi:MAG: single-stranded DNA-binding protein [Acidobacteria bacterium]|nr:single-stranded DNA-binding protein [Acidobacteriota bacterium]